ncbi:MAG: hypothetical protein R2865_01450 [Deinococcales bacterium]
MLSQTNGFLALIIAIIVGLGLAILAQILAVRLRPQKTMAMLLGGLGGFLFGLALVFTIIVSLPIELNVNNEVIYPANMPTAIGNAVASSKLVQLGRDIVLYEIYEEYKITQQITSAAPAFVKQMHGLLVMDRPWEQ